MMICPGSACLSEKAAKDQTTKVLIVEDEKLQRLNCRAVLEDMGHQVMEAADGSEGLAVFKRELPDLVLTDLRMPVMDGLSLIRKLHEIAPDTPVIVLSGVGTLNEAVASLRIGAWDYLAKPMADGDMENMVNKIIEKAQPQNQLKPVLPRPR